MDITGKELREVEFRDRLRGYDTDEVDEFLEKVAIAVDELHAELAVLAERAARAERQAEEVPALDDDGIRRTLVLAQRTADLAIKEAQSEADRLLADAKAHSEATLAETVNAARKARSDAESEIKAVVDRLAGERDHLERQVLNLKTIVDTERARLSDALSAMLSLVGENFAVSEALTAAVPQRSAESPDNVDPFSLGLPDIDNEIDAEEEISFPGLSSPSQPGSDDLDPDEALWERWAKSAAEFNENASPDDPFGLGNAEDERPS